MGAYPRTGSKEKESEDSIATTATYSHETTSDFLCQPQYTAVNDATASGANASDSGERIVMPEARTAKWTAKTAEAIIK